MATEGEMKEAYETALHFYNMGHNDGSELMAGILIAVLYAAGGSIDVPSTVFDQVDGFYDVATTDDPDTGALTYTLVRREESSGD